MNITNKVFRLRSSSALLDDYHELENQEIYMAEPESLNDPMEGFISYLWNGNICDWNNLIRNYLMCLEHMINLAYLYTDEKYLENAIPVFKTTDDLPTEKYKKLIVAILDSFYKADGVNEYISLMSIRKKVSEDELKVFLKTLHLTAIRVINNEHYKSGLIPKKQLLEVKENGIKEYIRILTEGIGDDNFDKIYQVLISSQKEIIDEMYIVTYCNSKNFKQRFLVTEFIDSYIKSLKKITFSDTYISCFMNNYNNSAMWGYYGDKHDGICLIFKVNKENGKSFLNLNNRKYELKAVNYEDNTPEINFFESFGRLPMKIIDDFWYKDIFGNQSEHIKHFETKEAEDKWRKNYWQNFLMSHTLKYRDWIHENESRIIIYDTLQQYTSTNSRKFKYKFSDLDGIIFGYKTTLDIKKRIIDIIESKCLKMNRTDFKFYQTEFNSFERVMNVREMRNIKFS